MNIPYYYSFETPNKSNGRGYSKKQVELAKKAVQKIGELGFEQKKLIVERVIDKIVATPQEVQIWGHIPIPAFAGANNRKVKYEPKHRDSRAT